MEVSLKVGAWHMGEIRYLVDQLNRGGTLKDIARHLRRSYPSVVQQVVRLREAGKLPPRRRRSIRSMLADGLDEDIRRLHRKGYSDRDIAGKLGIGFTSARLCRLRLGLPPHPQSSARNRAKASRTAVENRTLFIKNALEAEALGWPGRTRAEAQLLNVLVAQGGRVRAGAVRAALGWSHQWISYVLARLREAGVVSYSRRAWTLNPGHEPVGNGYYRDCDFQAGEEE